MAQYGVFDVLSLLLFIVFFGGNMLVAIPSWLFFTLFMRPDHWGF